MRNFATCTRCATAQLSTSWLEDALSKDALTFHFQPIVDTERNQVHAREALVRFEDRTGGAIVAEAQRIDRIHAFDSYCRQKAIRVGATATASLNELLFINFMPSSIYEPEACLRSTFAALADTEIEPSQIVFEVVESETIPSVGKLIRIRDYYRAHGFGFALDDCGTGSNTTHMIRTFRPDYLKIDKSATASPENPVFAELVEIGQSLGCKLIAEGVETQGQFEALAQAGVGLMQGWYFGRPAPLV